MTLDNIIDEIAKINSTVTRNRLTALVKSCRSVEEFTSLEKGDALAKYRQTSLGQKSKHDLGPITYTELAKVQSKVLGKIRDEKLAQKQAERNEMKFTRDEITLIASFMETFKVDEIDVRKFRDVLASLTRNKA